MIGYLEGTIIGLTQHSLTILAGGVGYDVFVSPVWLIELREGTEIKIWIHHVVREDASDLYGVRTQEELLMFKMLDDVSGVGPKSVLGILSINTPHEVRSAIARGDTAVLTRVSGIGRKIAERIILELRSKFSEHDDGGLPRAVDRDIVSALVALGYSSKDAEQAAGKVLHEGNISTRIRQALKHLS